MILTRCSGDDSPERGGMRSVGGGDHVHRTVGEGDDGEPNGLRGDVPGGSLRQLDDVLLGIQRPNGTVGLQDGDRSWTWGDPGVRSHIVRWVSPVRSVPSR